LIFESGAENRLLRFPSFVGVEITDKVVYNSIGIVSLERRDPKMLKKVVQ